ncbi:MAG: protein-L-isoaspartate O-methyltransferase [Acidihalobacter sp.]|jgi:protein-L-isoaspartate(D-aspartate) O-methyltransferase|uniref:protein-L-isoaspartate O-methyltransferase family protein n=1 Tax=Acidihalobacter sp. TaxID=1872108 RepID=UPI00307E87B9
MTDASSGVPQDSTDFAMLRFNMVEQQIRPWDVLDPRVLDVLGSLWRHHFVPPDQQRLAYGDLELPLGHGEHMMAPKVEGRLLQALAPQAHETVLEIGTGSGFLAACLAHLAARIDSVDIIPDFKHSARPRLAELGLLDRVALRTGDAAHGWSHQRERYDVVAVTGSLPTLEMAAPFERLLNPGGRMFAVVGVAPVMEAMLITRSGEHAFSRISLFETSLAPLRGLSKPAVFQL